MTSGMHVTKTVTQAESDDGYARACMRSPRRPMCPLSPQVTQASGGVLANELLELNLRSTAAESAHLPMVTRR
jgi:hypothetical protein